jgi:hypothetical protein
MNTIFGFERYGARTGRVGMSGARVGSDSNASVVAATDTRALALNTGIGSWIAALGPAARPTDTAFAASWGKWYADWIAFRNMFNVLPSDPLVNVQESADTKVQVDDRQKALYVWESRFEAQKAGKDTMAPTPASIAGGFPTWAWIPIVGGAAYGIWHFFLKAHWR